MVRVLEVDLWSERVGPVSKKKPTTHRLPVQSEPLMANVSTTSVLPGHFAAAEEEASQASSTFIFIAGEGREGNRAPSL